MKRRDRMEIIPPETPLLIAYASAVNKAVLLRVIQYLSEE